MPKISVIMSVFDEDPYYLDLSIKSLINQDFDDFEVICIDDGSSDSACIEILQQANSNTNFKLFRQNNFGLTKSLNRAFSLSSGEYIARQDSDDISLSNRLRLQCEFLDLNKEVALIGSQVEFIDVRETALWRSRLPKNRHSILRAFKTHNPFVHGSICMRREIFEKFNGYNENLRVSQDYDLFWRISKESEVRNLSRVLYQQRRHALSISSTKSELQKVYGEIIRAANLKGVKLNADEISVRVGKSEVNKFHKNYASEKQQALSHFCNGFRTSNLYHFVKLLIAYPLKMNAYAQFFRAMIVTFLPFTRGWLL